MTGDAEAALRASWESNAAAWTDAVRTGAIASRRAGTDAAVVEAAGARGSVRVLDVGCGEGWLARALSARGHRVVGIDGSGALVEEASRSGGALFRHLCYDELIADPAAAGGPFDTIVCNFALLGDPVAPLLEALRTAARGALVIQTVHPISAGEPYADGWRTESFEAFGTGAWRPMPWYFRTFGGWHAEIARSGWRIDEVREPSDPETGRPLSLLFICR